MNKEELLSYLSEKYEIPIIVDLSTPTELDQSVGKFRDSDLSIHLCNSTTICTIFHEIGHWVWFTRFIDIWLIYSEWRLFREKLPLPNSCKKVLDKLSIILYRFFMFFININEENRADYFACKTLSKEKNCIGKRRI